jgi:hypothetical protein
MPITTRSIASAQQDVAALVSSPALVEAALEQGPSRRIGHQPQVLEDAENEQWCIAITMLSWSLKRMNIVSVAWLKQANELERYLDVSGQAS